MPIHSSNNLTLAMLSQLHARLQSHSIMLLLDDEDFLASNVSGGMLLYTPASVTACSAQSDHPNSFLLLGPSAARAQYEAEIKSVMPRMGSTIRSR